MNHVIILNAYFGTKPSEDSLSEITSLCSSTDCDICGIVNCRVTRINPATYIGRGKVDQVKKLADETNADMIIFNGELSPSQTLNVADITERDVITKTNLILDIFARRACSDEGKILVELAQLKYIYPRLKGKGDELSRQGGGIGTVGPGETKLETDRRYIKSRIKSLERSLKEIQKRQKLQQQRRSKNLVKTVAIVGYTNAGKSTLLNALCDSDVYESDRVFATLDPTARTTVINDEKIVFVDTVGFIKDLPDSLVEAFKSTLEIAKSADLLLCMSDIITDFTSQRDVTDEILNEIHATQNRLYVLNKCDKSESGFVSNEYIRISAISGSGLTELKNSVYENLFGSSSPVTLTLPYEKAHLVESIKKLCFNVQVEYDDEKVTVKGQINDKKSDKLKQLINS